MRFRSVINCLTLTPPLAYKRNIPLIMFVPKPRAPSAYPRLIPPRPLTSPPCHHSLTPCPRLMSLLALRHPNLYLTSLHPYPYPTPRSHPGRPPPLAYKRNLPLIMFVPKPRAPSAYPRLIPPRPLTSPPCHHSLTPRTAPTHTTRPTSPPPSPRA